MPRILMYVGGSLLAWAIYLKGGHGIETVIALTGIALIFAGVFEAIRVYKGD